MNIRVWPGLASIPAGAGSRASLDTVIGVYSGRTQKMGDLTVLDKINAATIVVIIGAGLLLISLLADVLGVGDDPGFGNQQKMGSVVGLLILVTGIYFTRKSD